MKDYKREPQPENWWIEKICPKMSKKGLAVKCRGKDCALWLITRIEDQTHFGVCTD